MMPYATPAQPEETPTLIRDRALSLVDYLLAVRAQIEKPSRAVPDGDAFWTDALPRHPACQAAPTSDDSSWLRVGMPPRVPPITAPAAFADLMDGGLSARREPKLREPLEELTQEPARLRWEFERWREGQWRPWAGRAAVVDDVRELHDQLFDLRHRLDMNTVDLELVWGHGVMVLEVAGQPVRYPLVVTPVAIEYDADRALVSVVPEGEPRLQTDALTGLDERYLSQLLDLATAGGHVDVDVWDDLQRRELFERALRRLGHDPVIRDPGAPAPRVAHIRDTGVLFARPRQRMLRRFLEELRARLLAGDLDSIGALSSILAHEPSRLAMPTDQPDQWKRTGDRLLMPLPTNEAQESIARRLAEHRSVAVQGPPGTGKTHTIRNLICHLMANGKRVLVVAQKEEPLRVLRDGLPEQVRSLCLAVLGRSADQLGQLQLAARELSDRAATLDPRAAQRTVDSLTAQLEQTEHTLANALVGLRRLAESDAARYTLDDVELTPSEVGAWLAEHAGAYGEVPDQIADGVPAPLSSTEFTALLQLARALDPADRYQALCHLPASAELPVANDIRAARERLSAVAQVVDRLGDDGVRPELVRSFGAQELARLVEATLRAAADLAAREGSWTERLGDLVTEPLWATGWHEHVSACQGLLQQLALARRVVAGHQVTAPEGEPAPSRALFEQLKELRQRLATGKAPSRLTQKALARLADSYHVDGQPLRGPQDVDVVLAFLDQTRMRTELAQRWAQWFQTLRVPHPHAGDEPELWAGRMAAEAAAALDWGERSWPGLRAGIARITPQVPATVDSAGLRNLAAVLSKASAVFEHDQLREGERRVAALLEQGMAAPDASPLWRVLELNWRAPDPADWDAMLTEARRLASLRPDVQRYQDLLARLAEVAPAWAAAIDDGTAPVLTAADQDCARRWRWRQAQTWFDTTIGAVDPAALGRSVEQARESIRRLTEQLVVASAWLATSQALDDRRRAALADWSTALRKIGKGTGKNASRWQAHAQQSMAQAVDAVPVWVMTIDRAVEQFANGARFDAVIVDEASQADMFALPVLSLATRAVVVGDDQQIGPQLSFVGSAAGLINAHLQGVPSAEHFDPESSLYDHAVRRSPERILLTEHFRCVPAIIEFSSLHYYNGKIEPLRTDLPAGIGEPVKTVYVPEGVRQPLASFGDVNVAEADALVERVTAIVADPAYADKTIGVISLLSTSGQAMYLFDRIRRTIGVDEVSRRRLRVGDSYTFQGDERDIVLVSLVVSPLNGRVAHFTKREYHRRVNVAASRARDQLWVFHSVQPSDLLEDDARAKLLRYCQNLTPAEEVYDNLEQRCDSGFERAVLRRLLLRGYRPRPQYRIGGYRIDFVLPAPDGRRLAIECDGDPYHGPEQWESDIRRQAILERVGNCVFVRIRGSMFSRDPDAAMAQVWQRAEELGINPFGDETPTRTPAPAAAPTLPPVPEPVAVHPGPVPQSRLVPRPAPMTEPEPIPEPEPAPMPEPQRRPEDDHGYAPGQTDQPGHAVRPATAGTSAHVTADPFPPPKRQPAAPEPAGPAAVHPGGEGVSPRPRPQGAPATRPLNDGRPYAQTGPYAQPGMYAQPGASEPQAASRGLVGVSAPIRATSAPSRPTLHPAAPVTNTDGPDQLPDIDAPPGYRHIAWLRPPEAEAAQTSYRSLRDVPIREDGKVIGWARFHGSGSELARKYRANVLIERASQQGPRTVCWVRLAEAEAILEAARLRRDATIVGPAGRTLGLVQYYSPSSGIAARYRSATRLLRHLPTGDD